MYKIYTTILAKRLREEVEEKGIIPKNQTGFKKRKRVIDNIYALNYLVQRQTGRKNVSEPVCRPESGVRFCRQRNFDKGVKRKRSKKGSGGKNRSDERNEEQGKDGRRDE